MARIDVADTFFKGLAKGGEQQLFNQIRRLVRGLKEKFPGLEADKAWEKIFWVAEPVGRTFLETLFPKGSIWTRTFDKFMEEFNQEVTVLAEKGSKPASAFIAGGGVNKMKKSSSVWMNGVLYPGLGFHGECPARHHFKTVTKKRKKDKGPEEEYQDEVPRPGFRPFGFEAFLASGARAPQIEGERVNPGDVGELFVPDTCACEALFARDKEELERQKNEADAPKKGAAAKEDRSVAGYIGKAIAGKIPGVDQTKIDQLIGFLTQLSPAEMVGLDEIDSEHEFVALASATTIAQLKMLLAASKDRKVRGLFADALHLPVGAAHAVVETGKKVAGAAGRGIEAAAKRGEAIARQLPGELKTFDGKLNASGKKFANDQARCEKIEDFAWQNRIKDIGAFRERVLEKGLDLDNINIVEAQQSFGRRA